MPSLALGAPHTTSYFSSPLSKPSELEKKINYNFKDKSLFNISLTHKSLEPNPEKNYERLEFLGDAVIDIIVSRELMRDFPEGDEGLLTQRRAALVQKPYLASIGPVSYTHLTLPTNREV